jgi:small subunit ribosomal protein S4
VARHLRPKHKTSRREGVDIYGTGGESLQRRLDVPPGGQRDVRRRRASDYALQLRAKQRVKFAYGMTEGQFRRFFVMARRMPGETGTTLLQLLERRLDNVVYRLGFARTRPMARQLVSHRHVLVNGQKVNVPSYLVEPGDEIALDPRTASMPTVQAEVEERRQVPGWLARDGFRGRVVGQPRREDIEPDIQENLIVEFYAR